MLPTLLRLLDLRRDQRAPEEIAQAIEGGVRSAGTKLWVLIFAIFIASIGLNVNSTAVIIGAMLISPLMGPIVAIGYGAGVNDFALIKRAVRTLAFFVVVSLLTATLYFAVSPLSQAQSELLARTSPTLWDVAIAFFGGAAGIVAATRRESSNVVPGVGIATALMPPLCTAGYGLASRNLEYFGGAFYLFSINAFFIAFSTLVIARLLRLPARAEVEERLQRRTRLFIGAAVAIMVVPSAYLAWELVRRELFTAAAAEIVSELSDDTRYVLLGSTVSAKSRTLTLTIGGEAPPPTLASTLETRLSNTMRGQARVAIRFAGSDRVDLAMLKQELQRDLFQTTAQQLESQQTVIRQLQLEASSVRARREARAGLLRELRAEFPGAVLVTIAQGEQAVPTDTAAADVFVAHLVTAEPISAAERQRLQARLATRFPGSRLDLIIPKPN